MIDWIKMIFFWSLSSKTFSSVHQYSTLICFFPISTSFVPLFGLPSSFNSPIDIPHHSLPFPEHLITFLSLLFLVFSFWFLVFFTLLSFHLKNTHLSPFWYLRFEGLAQGGMDCTTSLMRLSLDFFSFFLRFSPAWILEEIYPSFDLWGFHLSLIISWPSAIWYDRWDEYSASYQW